GRRDSVGMLKDCCNASSSRGTGACIPVLLLRQSGFPEMHMYINTCRQGQAPPRIYYLVQSLEIDLLSYLCDLAVADKYIGWLKIIIEENSCVFNQNIRHNTIYILQHICMF
ncbi:MAG: hypothetical protein PWR29_1984, partial [Methanolobus sp.]|nr:hypothetical protein [Methanolobus sp.]